LWPNWWSIGFDLFNKGKIDGWRTTVKKIGKIDVNFKVCKKVQFDPYTFQFFLVPLVFKTSISIQTLSFLFFGSWFERGEGKSLDSNGRERKSRLTSIYTMKKVNFDINEFHLRRVVSPKCSLSFPSPKMVDLKSKSLFFFN
jgi:hypothetical protein